MAACLCRGGWFEEYGIMLSVKEGFLYMEVLHLVGVLWIVMSLGSSFVYWIPVLL